MLRKLIGFCLTLLIAFSLSNDTIRTGAVGNGAVFSQKARSGVRVESPPLAIRSHLTALGAFLGLKFKDMI